MSNKKKIKYDKKCLICNNKKYLICNKQVFNFDVCNICWAWLMDKATLYSPKKGFLTIFR